MTAPSRSRRLASLAASITLLYLAAFSPTTALDTDAGNAPNPLLDDLILKLRDGARRDGLDVSYESEFTVFGGGGLKGRASEDIHVLGNNRPERFTAVRGSTSYFGFSLDGITARDESGITGGGASRQDGIHSALEGDGTSKPEANTSGEGLIRRQETSTTVFVSANICRYPERKSGTPSASDPPQLWLLFSSDASDEHPDSTKPTAQTDMFYEGAAMKSIGASTSSVYFSIEAPNLSDDFEGDWTFEVAVSTSGWYHSFEDDETQNMLWTAGLDNASALLMTKNLTEDTRDAQAIMDSGPPFTLFVDSVDSPRLKGVRHSYCGLETYAQIASMKDKKPSDQVLMSMTTRGAGRLPKQQFWLAGLNSTTAYTGILVRTGQTSLEKRQNDGSSNGGVRVLPETQFQTTTGDNCRVITDLDFCTEVEYAVPANDNKFNTTSLAKKYDDYARTMYSNFEKAIQQIPCEAPVTSKYSLARSCDDCKIAYKNWLCTVAIPRCEDFSSNNPYALIRNAEQAFPNGTSLDESVINGIGRDKPALLHSRNAWIDEEIAPGPYKEILPCDDVCYHLVQSCPAAMGFGCPLPNGDDEMFWGSYAQRKDGEQSCSMPPSSSFVGGAATLTAGGGAVFAVLVAFWASIL
ncbi:related to Ca2+ channel [Cephalotrichum gorgonifer]|uniref:Related to Ca2+ channel n=1 Tax=Cephalotrichum gorgonifer TaxID=2041049 RepID=A0AAE8MUA1_9PEZI|nr:related to Ca2+ channel [Cephalotrichum gorgonifer]